MKSEVREVNIEVKNPKGYDHYQACIREGKLIDFGKLGEEDPNKDTIKAYIQFCREVLAEMTDE